MSLFYFHGTRKPDFRKIHHVDYDDYWKERGFALRNKLMEREEIFFDWVRPNTKVIDIGCGNSRLLLELRQKKNCQVTGVDISPLVIDSMKKEGIAGMVADIQSPTFQLMEQYDYIIASEVWEHITQPEDLIQKLIPHTKHFVLSSTNSAFYRYRIGLLLNGRFPTQWMSHPSEHVRFWSSSDFINWLGAMGVEVLDVKASNGPALKSVWPNMFGHQVCYLGKVKNA